MPRFLKKKGNCNFPIILEVGRGIESIGSKKFAHAQERVLRTRYLHKEREMCAVPLDAVLDRRAERCSPRFRPGDRFWNQG